MFKRFLVLFLSLSLILVPCFSIKASAASDVNFDLLQYSYPDGWQQNTGLWQDDRMVTYALPGNTFIGYIDTIISFPYQSITAAYIADYGDTSRLTALEFQYLGNYTYRIYGDFGNTRESISLYFESSYSYLVMNIYRFDIYTSRIESVNVLGSLVTQDLHFNSTQTVTMPNVNTPATYYFTYASSAGAFTSDWISTVLVTDWEKFDSISVILDVYCDSVLSVSATLDNLPVSSSVSYLLFDGENYVVVNEAADLKANTYNVLCEARIIIDVDLSNVQRDLYSNLNINVTGTYRHTAGDQYVSLNRVVGFFDFSFVDPVIYLLRNLSSSLGTWFSNLYSNISTGLTALGNNIYDNFVDLTTNLRTWFTEVKSTINNAITNLNNSLQNLFSTLTTDLSTWFTEAKSTINNAITNLNDSIIYRFNLLSSNLNAWFSTTHDKLDQIINPDADETDQAIDDAQQGISDITAIEDQYAADLDSQLVSSEVDKVQNYGNALVFCSSILSRSFNNLGGYQIIYILPVCIGIFLFVSSRVRPITIHNHHDAPSSNDKSTLEK